jgi:hypothetical protein
MAFFLKDFDILLPYNFAKICPGCETMVRKIIDLRRKND